ncbi:hypothetical protein [Nonomuraea basaltis]|uniref:hypothetical protein n=1 Tax=Nonomuraea basaltis TaxID=2495887 RepID=UPI001485E493|nr:hypothetical protein [Nonomuraea basaltis]
MRVLIDKVLALVIPEERASAICGYQYKCIGTSLYKRLCCSSSGDNCGSWQRVGPCPL